MVASHIKINIIVWKYLAISVKIEMLASQHYYFVSVCLKEGIMITLQVLCNPRLFMALLPTHIALPMSSIYYCLCYHCTI